MTMPHVDHTCGDPSCTDPEHLTVVGYLGPTEVAQMAGISTRHLRRVGPPPDAPGPRWEPSTVASWLATYRHHPRRPAVTIKRKRVTGDPVGIEEIAKRLDVPVKTVRYWRSQGLLPAPRWRVSGNAAFEFSDIEQWTRATGRMK
jgi:hypothetical protein